MHAKFERAIPDAWLGMGSVVLSRLNGQNHCAEVLG
jgi:hypothetical protein